MAAPNSPKARYEEWVKWLKKQVADDFSEAAAARRLGITRQTLNRILSGKRSGLKTFNKMRNNELG